MLTILATVITFGIIIVIHELGHFTFAKLFGVYVHEFSFGMGPKLFSRKKGETTYSIRAFPIGGFVAMEGEDGNVTDGTDEGRSFATKKPWQKMIILVAGATMNLILGTILLMWVTSNQELLGTNVVAYVEEAAPFGDMLQPRDRIVNVNGYTTHSYSDVAFQIVRDEDGFVEMEIVREADPEQLSIFEKGEVMNITVPFSMVNDEATGVNLVQLDLVFCGVDNSLVGTFFYSIDWGLSVIKQVWFSLLDLVTGRYGLNAMAGPVGTAGVIGEAAARGIEDMIFLMAFMSINVGTFNLLPVPALDGGRMLFLWIEIISKRPVPEKYETAIHAGGMVLLLGFMFVVTCNDVLRLIKG